MGNTCTSREKDEFGDDKNRICGWGATSGDDGGEAAVPLQVETNTEWVREEEEEAKIPRKKCICCQGDVVTREIASGRGSFRKSLRPTEAGVSEFPQWGFTVFFVGYPPEKDLGPVPTKDDDKFAYCMRVPGCVELTWNHGSEFEQGDRIYHTGNADTTGIAEGQQVNGGFGHIGITVPDVYAACQRFKEQGAEFKKSPNSGGMKGLAFVKDPDGYLVEVLPLGKAYPFPTQETDCCGVSLTEGGGYKDNSK